MSIKAYSDDCDHDRELADWGSDDVSVYDPHHPRVCKKLRFTCIL